MNDSFFLSLKDYDQETGQIYTSQLDEFQTGVIHDCLQLFMASYIIKIHPQEEEEKIAFGNLASVSINKIRVILEADVNGLSIYTNYDMLGALKDIDRIRNIAIDAYFQKQSELNSKLDEVKKIQEELRQAKSDAKDMIVASAFEKNVRPGRRNKELDEFSMGIFSIQTDNHTCLCSMAPAGTVKLFPLKTMEEAVATNLEHKQPSGNA